ncbi:MAG TPA: glycosyltransferase family 2 protein, partial [Candidatus Omnitrophota bacterium]|nr:glycosyltransferase family 2 protein [Candidatus Omnitrophota bacterium]
MRDLSVSIVNYNSGDSLRKCLESIKNNIKTDGYEVIVVDNNSSDGSELCIRDYPFVRLIKNRMNYGASIAKNQSFRESDSKYVLILDSDIEILPGCLERLMDFLEKNKKAGIVGPRVLFGDLRPQHSSNKHFPGFISLFLNKLFFFSNIRYAFYRSMAGSWFLKKRYSGLEEAAWLGGMCLLARKDLLDKIKGMDERFFIYYDDVDLCLRTRVEGYKVYYLPEASVVHHMGKSFGGFNKFLFLRIYESELYFFEKHYGDPGKKIAYGLILCGLYLRIAIGFLF